MPSEQTQKTSSSSNPWKPAQAGLKDILAKAGQYGADPSMFTPVQGATTQDALARTEAIAKQGSAALPVLQNLTAGAQSGFNTGLGTLQSTASGANLGRVSPELAAALDRASADTANTVNQQFSAAGRYGSAGHAGVIADKVGALRTNALVDSFNRERDAQLGASNTLYGGGFQGAGMAGQMDEARLFTPQLLGQVGAARDAQAMGEKQAPLQALQFQAGQTLPIAGLGGTQTGKQTSSSSNPLGTAIGGVTTGLGLLSGGGGMGLAGLFGGMGGGGGVGNPTNWMGTTGGYAAGLPWAPR